MFLLDEMVKQAKEEDVQLDMNMISRVKNESERLIAERNLRFEMKKTVVMECNHDDVDSMEEKIKKAEETNVEKIYMEQAHVLIGKMKGNISARETYEMLHEYP